MGKIEKSRVSQARISRQGGEATRLHLLETAGRLFAERGYVATTSKEICLLAKTNAAAVNYHFGGKDGLYAAVLEEVHNHFISIDELSKIAGSTPDAHERLGRLIDRLVDNLTNEGWRWRVGMREFISPTPLMDAVLGRVRSPKVAIIKGWLSELTGYDINNPILSRCLLNVFAPCAILLIVNKSTLSNEMTNILNDKAALQRHIKVFAFAGLEAISHLVG